LTYRRELGGAGHRWGQGPLAPGLPRRGNMFYERAVKKKLLPSWPPANLFLCS